MLETKQIITDENAPEQLRQFLYAPDGKGEGHVADRPREARSGKPGGEFTVNPTTGQIDGTVRVDNNTHQQIHASDNPTDELKQVYLDRLGLSPDDYEIVGPIKVSTWDKYHGGELYAYKGQLVPKHLDPKINVEESMNRIIDSMKGVTLEPSEDDGYAFTLQLSDLQVGKGEGGGIEGILQRTLSAVYEAKVYYEKLRKIENITSVQIVSCGDMTEGNCSQNGRTVRQHDLEITSQVVVFQRLLFYLVELFAPITPELYIDVVGGNHDESQRFQQVAPGSNWATTAAIALSDSLTHNNINHVKVRIPRHDRGYMEVPVGSSTMIVLHGHQFRRGKAMEWWKGQSFGGYIKSHGGIMQHGHYHSESMTSDRDHTVICSSTLDGGSGWYEDKTGATSKRGVTCYLSKNNSVAYYTLIEPIEPTNNEAEHTNLQIV